MQVFNLCRICLTEDRKAEKMHNLFDDDNQPCYEIVQKIEECGGIQLKLVDEFPKMICNQCLEYLNTSYKFRSMCQASENALLTAIIKSEMNDDESQEDYGNNTEFLDESSIASDEIKHDKDIFIDLQNEMIGVEDINIKDLDDENENEELHVTEVDATLSVFSENEEVLETEDDDADGVVSYNFITQDNAAEEEGDYHLDITPKRRRIHKNVKKYRPKGGVKAKRRGRPKSCVIKTKNDGEEEVDETEKTTKPMLNRRRRKCEEPPTSIMCELCGNIYPKQALLNVHMRRHMAEKPFECEICSKTFACPSEIRRHMRVHTGEKPYNCRYCGRTFADRSTNIKHERIHTNERPFPCNTCGKSFSYSNVLKNHMLTHTGEKPFCCLPCNKSFSRKHQLDQHYSTLIHQQRVNIVKNTGTLKLETDELTLGDGMVVTVLD